MKLFCGRVTTVFAITSLLMIPVDEIRQFVDQVSTLISLNEKEKIVLKFYCATNQAIFKGWNKTSNVELAQNQIKDVLRPTVVTDPCSSPTSPTSRRDSKGSTDNVDSRDSDEQMLIYGLTGGFSEEEPDEICGPKEQLDELM